MVLSIKHHGEHFEHLLCQTRLGRRKQKNNLKGGMDSIHIMAPQNAPFVLNFTLDIINSISCKNVW
jgi:hypothetical protein